ncbi:hypothetical protein, partial [Pseudomonas aeruginosa]|uniref:hypothetical protein n=1 Tax=Pseudomonas aeruginosa TaxID=287 RepID=UPI003D2B1871
ETNAGLRAALLNSYPKRTQPSDSTENPGSTRVFAFLQTHFLYISQQIAQLLAHGPPIMGYI